MDEKKSVNGWDEVKALINFRLNQQDEHFTGLSNDLNSFKRDVSKEINDLKIEVSSIKVHISWRSAVVGGITGLIGAIGIILIYLANMPH